MVLDCLRERGLGLGDPGPTRDFQRGYSISVDGTALLRNPIAMTIIRKPIPGEAQAPANLPLRSSPSPRSHAHPAQSDSSGSRLLRALPPFRPALRCYGNQGQKTSVKGKEHLLAHPDSDARRPLLRATRDRRAHQRPTTTTTLSVKNPGSSNPYPQTHGPCNATAPSAHSLA